MNTHGMGPKYRHRARWSDQYVKRHEQRGKPTPSASVPTTPCQCRACVKAKMK